MSLHTEWPRYREYIKDLQNVKVHRLVILGTMVQSRELPVTDASEKAYGATIYGKSRLLNSSITVCLLCYKSSVTPTSMVALSRLELCAAVLGAELFDII